MSCDHYRPHVHVILEDDADREMYNGLESHWAIDTRKIEVLPNAGGWPRVREGFKVVQSVRMRPYDYR